MKRYSRKIAVAVAAFGLAAAVNAIGGEAKNMYGGPVYSGPPALGVTAALVKAGGGPEHFSTATALTNILGARTVNAEVAKLTKQYGKKKVQQWLAGQDYVVTDGLKRATEAGVKLPEPPANLHGQKLAVTLIEAGTAKDGTFWSGLLYDKAVSHAIHSQVMEDIDKKYGADYDMNIHRITNQAFTDVAQALGKKQVKLAALH